MKNVIWINLTTESGELLERFQIVIPFASSPVKTSAKVRDHIEMRFETEDA